MVPRLSLAYEYLGFSPEISRSNLRAKLRAKQANIVVSGKTT